MHAGNDTPGAVTCPRCGHSQEGGVECNRCGVIFAKARQRPEPPSAGPAIDAGLPVFQGQPTVDQGTASGGRFKRVLVILLAVLVTGVVRGVVKFLLQPDPPAVAEAKRRARNSPPLDQLKVEATSAAIAHAGKDAGLKTELGEPLQAQAEPDVQVTVYQGSGRATVNLRITGPIDSARARVTLHLEDGVWSVTDMISARAGGR